MSKVTNRTWVCAFYAVALSAAVVTGNDCSWEQYDNDSGECNKQDVPCPSRCEDNNFAFCDTKKIDYKGITNPLIRQVAPGTGEKIVSSVEEDCREEFQCGADVTFNRPCTYSGGIWYCDPLEFAAGNCYTCSPGPALPMIRVTRYTLEPCGL